MTKDNIEFEAKILNIDIITIVQKLEELGAKKIDDYRLRRYVFDTIPSAPERWVRLRSNGKVTTLAVKEISNDSIDGTQEWETKVDDIETTLAILEKIGITPRGYQENTRTEYKLQGVEISIDIWPGINPYVEIEGKNADEVIKIAEMLGYGKDELTSRNTESLYAEKGINLKEVKELKFKEER